MYVSDTAQPRGHETAKSSEGFQQEAPTVTLPKGGGAIRGIGEKFAANPVTGTGSMSVPIPTSPGRSGVGPQLSLTYDSGAGNGPFGFGWNLSLPSITRKTDKGLPQYFDAVDSDIFILSGAEDLVPVLVQGATGEWIPEAPPRERTVDGKTYRIRRYRPRIEGLFARIERWTNTADASDVFWRSISKDNITTWYGRTADSRIVDPSDATRIFSWLICETHDDKGNLVAYGYKPEDSKRIFEDSAGKPVTKAHERNRSDESRAAQRYIKRIRYGNRAPFLPALKADTAWPEPPAAPWPKAPGTQPLDGSDDWMFEVVFDYGEHYADTPVPTEARPWPARPDPFSSYRAGFEVRTYRICQRVLMFHHFPGEAGVERDCLVRSTDFTYTDEVNPTDARNPVYTFLKAVTQTGHRRHGDGYDHRSLPPVELTYTEPTVQETVEEVDPTSLDNLPIGLDGSAYRWTDLHGEGIPGILTEQAGTWFYKRNLSPINERPGHGPDGPDGPGHISRRPHVEAAFAPLETVALKPNATLGAGADFMDLAGDGQPDVVLMEDPTPGLYEHDEAEGWQPFRPFTSRLNRDFRDPNLKLVDLDGDGHADVLITDDDALVWHASLAEAGFGPARRVAQALDEEKGPRVVFADGTQSIYLADLSGDGLTDIVRIRNGEVCYWPNLGHCRFGAKVTMDNAPWFDHPDQFDHKRIRLADIDGSGTTDIIYLHRDGVRLYFNQSGNGWSEPQVLEVFPRIDDLASIVPVDLLGNGTACLVWSSPLPGDARRPMRYVNLMGDRKPHLLVKTVNNLGAGTRVDYAPSTKFYLQDKRDGKPWITRLPFPVHVVERVETIDHISRNRFVTRYAYHHGYFDGEEREFRGFGMVEQWDTEEFATLTAEGTEPWATNRDPASHVPPALTRTWFHTGAYLDRDHISLQFEDEYYREPGLSKGDAGKLLLPDTTLPKDLPPEEEQEACRALKGMMLRQEVYALDGTRTDEYPHGHPYTVVEQDFTIRHVQPRAGNRHGVFFTHPCEVITYHYERKLAPVLNGKIVDEVTAANDARTERLPDPRVQHALTLEVDPFGNVLREAAIGYGRRWQDTALPNDADRDQQTRLLITYTENRFTKSHQTGLEVIDLPDGYRKPLPCESRTYELTGFKPKSDARFSFDECLAWPGPAPEIPYEQAADPTKQQKRIIEHTRTLYRPDDCGVARNDPLALLPPERFEPLALPGESYKLAFTPGLLAQVYQVYQRNGQPLLPDPGAVLRGTAGDQGGYVDLDGNGHWWIPSGRSFYHPDEVTAAVELAEARDHFFLPRRYRDPFGQKTVVTFDSHDLLMAETRDALNNRVTVDANDYRVLQPRLVSDPNRNQTEVAFDTLGMVVGTAVMSKPTDNPRRGDRLDVLFSPDPSQGMFDAFIDKPREASPDPKASAATEAAHDLLANATTRIVYDLDRFKRLREPPFAATIARETHTSDLEQDAKSNLQISFSYSDGFGREIQKKIQAEPGPLVEGGPDISPRWVGSGWTIFNNKGKPVRQYEPFFSKRQRPDGSLDSDHRFEFGVQVGVSPILFYDPAERVVATLHPNHSWEKVVFDPWQQTTYDVNDTVLFPVRANNPLRDADVAGYFGRLPDTDYLPTWHELRTQPAHAAAFASRYPAAEDRQNETKAAEGAAAHADTPTTAHFDALGRPLLTVARNRVICEGHLLHDKPDEQFRTRVELDIEGDQRKVLDERKLPDADNLPLGALEQRIVMQYAYDMLGNRIHQSSMEAGARWMLNDVTGNPIRAWDSRGHDFTTKYDALRRPIEQYVRGNFSDPDPLKPNSDPRTLNPPNEPGLLVDKFEYGEPPAGATPAQEAEAQRLNLRTRIYRHSDPAGVATNARLDANGKPTEAYDFKGNLLRSTRQLVSDYKAIPDWLRNPRPKLDAETFEGRTRYDALNRPIQSVAPHSSLGRGEFNVIQPVFNEANLLERVDVWLERAAEPDKLLDPSVEAPSPVSVANIDYDAKGQRTLIDYKNGATTFYSYDPLTFRLTQLLTKRKLADFPRDDPQVVDPDWPGKQVQNLHYTYDPAGNITHIRDDAQQAIYFKNQRVEPSNDYVYDALYRLIQAEGREHLGQAGAPIPHAYNDAGRVGILSANPPGRFAPNDRTAMGRYTERYVYDLV